MLNVVHALTKYDVRCIDTERVPNRIVRY